MEHRAMGVAKGVAMGGAKDRGIVLIRRICATR